MSQSFELFSDIFAFRDNALSRLDPRVKLAIAAAGLMAVILSSKVYLPLGICACCLATLLLLRMPARLVALRLVLPLGIAAMVCVMRAFLSGSTPMATFSIAGRQLTATREGLASGGLIASRVLGSVGIMLLLSMVTPAHKIFVALRWARMPKTWVETAMMMYRYIFALVDHTSEIFVAQKTRLGYVGFKRSLSSMGVLAGAVMERSLEQADKTHEAMVARCYKDSLPVGEPASLGRHETMIIAVFLAMITSAWFLAEGWL
jgi:cobalt/nickel transport system permease protein